MNVLELSTGHVDRVLLRISPLSSARSAAWHTLSRSPPVQKMGKHISEPQRVVSCQVSARRLIAVETLSGTKTLKPDTTSDFHKEYTLGEFLGQGCFGVVRAGVHNSTGMEVAVKLVPIKSQKESALRELQKEVQLWQEVMGCENVVQLYAVYQDAEYLYLVQEVCHGGDLQTLLESQGPLSESEAADAIHGVLNVLLQCHRQNICYGDVKPANFLLKKMYPSLLHMMDPSTPKGQITIKATDFGCSQQSSTTVVPRLQRVCGTPLFMAPEIHNRMYTYAVDMWAVGVLMYHLLSNRFPFWDMDSEYLAILSPEAIRSDIMSADIVTSGPMEAISSDAKDLIKAMLCRDPKRRITAEEALQHPWFKNMSQPEPAGANVLAFRSV